MLLEDINARVLTLENEHSKHMQCKNGCAMCCMDYKIFPIEFYFILDKLKNNYSNFEAVDTSNEKDCLFLKNNSCLIYLHRPIICRTHGLPLLYMNDENEWELSACELNFTEFDFAEFNFDNTFPQDKFNSKLYVLNKEFIKTAGNGKYKETDLIPIKDLMKHIK